MRSYSSDKTLVDGLRAGRSDAFERLYGDYRGPIYNLCARIVGDREEAKDLTQEVFIAAFDRLPEPGAEPLKLRPWLYRVATNACFNHLRSRGRLSGGGDAELENTASGVDEFERAQTVAFVEQTLGEMNERYRAVLVLKDLQGLPAEEIATVMEVSRPTADVLVHRARTSFKIAFAKFAGDKAPAPASLGLVLAPLAVPAALHAMPPLAVIAGHAGGGLLAKIGAALTTKVAIGAAAATVVIGGGAAVYEVRSHGGGRADAATTAASPSRPTSGTSAPRLDPWHSNARWAGHDRALAGHDGHDGHWDSHSGMWVRDGGDHQTDDSHSPGHVTEHAAATTTQPHDGGTSTSSGTHDAGSGTWSSGHDSGDTPSGHDVSPDGR